MRITVSVGRRRGENRFTDMNVAKPFPRTILENVLQVITMNDA